jgi:hypothetical protein
VVGYDDTGMKEQKNSGKKQKYADDGCQRYGEFFHEKCPPFFLSAYSISRVGRKVNLL